MKQPHAFKQLSRPARTGLGAFVAGLVIGGVVWHGAATGAQSTAPRASASASQPAIAHSVAAGKETYSDIVKAVAPAVVTIRTEGRARVSNTQFDGDEFFRRFFGEPFDDRPNRGQRPGIPRTFKQRALGSGVIVGSDGYILTNAHVVDGAEDIRVEITDGRTLSAKVIGTDKASDLALIKVTANDLQTISIGNSDAVQVGDVVLAVGNPLGIGQTVTMGIISAKSRQTGVGDGSYEDFLQTDAPINHGNSGGALVNTKGELVGINSQIMSSTGENIGIAFAIPANMARHVMDELRRDGRVRRAQLGVVVQPVTSDLADSLGLKSTAGAIVSSVAADSPAGHAGLKRGDVITSFNGQSVRDSNSLRNRVADSTPGASATVGFIRDGAEQTATVKLGEKEAGPRAENESEEPADDKEALGILVAPLTADVAGELGLSRGATGLVVENVNPNGRAADAGIRRGDVILEVNRQAVKTTEELRAAVRKTSDKPLLLLVHRRGEGDRFVTVRSSLVVGR